VSQPTMRELYARARERRARIALPEIADARIVGARTLLEEDELCEVIWVEDPRGDSRFEDVTAHIWSRRRHKGVDEAQAAKLAADPLFFAASLCALGHADGAVSGASRTTADVIRAGLQCIGTPPDLPLVSSMFLMLRGEEALSFADCGVLPDPNAEDLVHIAGATADNHRRLTGIEPKVAFLSFSTKGSAEHERVDKMRRACSAFCERRPDVVADGELQFDAAYVPEVARRKSPGSPLAGGANVFVFPDLDAGNIAYKVAQRLGGFTALGPLLQGLALPFLDLSRGCTPEDVRDVAVIASALGDQARC
jgi:phosphate acetyltransferase